MRNALALKERSKMASPAKGDAKSGDGLNRAKSKTGKIESKIKPKIKSKIKSRGAQGFFASRVYDKARVLIVGRANTGKSTLFNRMLRARRSPTTAAAGMTQDWLEGELILSGGSLCLIDTAGVELGVSNKDSNSNFNSKSRAEGVRDDSQAWNKTRELIEESSLILFVLDARASITSVELDLAKVLRGRRVIVVANKGEGLEHVPEPCLSLGFSELYLASALHGRGMADLLSRIDELTKAEQTSSNPSFSPSDELTKAEQTPSNPSFFPSSASTSSKGISSPTPIFSNRASSASPTSASCLSSPPSPTSVSETLPRGESCFSLALLGMTNSGKSTLANRLLGSDRMLVSSIAGTTRNAVDGLWREGEEFATLVDTAGLRRKSRVSQSGDAIEQASSRDSLRFLRMSSVVGLVIDSGSLFSSSAFASSSDFVGIKKQELLVAQRVLSRGKPLILLMNKWDLLSPPQRKKTLSSISLPDFQGLPIITMSALYDNDFSVIFKTAKKLHSLTTRREKTAKVNAWLEEAQKIHKPPIYRNKQITLRYASQVEAAPPRFVIHANTTVANEYIRYLTNSLRRFFDWPAVPIVIKIQKRKNDEKNLNKKTQRKNSSSKNFNKEIKRL